MKIKKTLHIETELLQEFARDSKLVIWGGNENGEKLYRYLTQYSNAQVLFFCDNDPMLRKCCGLPVVDQSYLREQVFKDNAIKVVIASQAYQEIRWQLLGVVGLPAKQVLYAKGIESGVFGSQGNSVVNWDSDVFEIEKHHDELISTLNILEDERSKADLKKFLSYRITYDPSYLAGFRRFKMNALGFPTDISDDVSECEVVIDGGAHDGSSLRRYLKAGVKGKFYCFEPERNNFSGLLRTVENYGAEGFVDARMQGLGAVACVSYLSGSDLSGYISPDGGGDQVDITTLDASGILERVTFIKLNIEGYEGPALEGAAQILKKDKPRLIISNHHHLRHLWEVPLLIKKINPEYKIYYRQMGWSGPYDKLYDIQLFAV